MKPLKGLYKDSLPIDQPQGTYRHAENVNLNMDVGSISSEEGIEQLTNSMPAGFVPLAYEVAPDKRIIVWYISEDTEAKMGIGLLEGGIFTPVLKDDRLLFTDNSVIQTTARLDKEGNLLVYWTDGVNPPRFYNLDIAPTFTDINELNIFDYITSIGSIYLDQVRDSGGSLYSGSYVFALRYIDQDDNKSNFFDLTRPIDIVKDSGEEFIEGTPTVRTSKSIRLQLNNLDETYQFAEIAVVRYEGSTVAETTLLPKIIIDGTQGAVTYGGNSLGRDISFEEITINKVSYTSAKAMTQLDGVMYMGNMRRSEEIDYQTYANNIKTYLTKKGLSELGHADEDNTYYSMSFRRGEVYAFYISFILKDGTETEAFHIPGRAEVPLGTETDLIDTSAVGDNRSSISSTIYRFQLYSKADPTYGMGFWQNNPGDFGGEYPTNNDKFKITDIDANGNDVPAGTLEGEPVRHHRFPDEVSEPVISNTTGREANVTVLGVRFENIKIPKNIKDRVEAVKFYYAEKNSSNRINLDEGFAVGQDIATNSQWNVIDETDVYRNTNMEAANGPKDYPAISLLPFSSLLNRQSISGVDYVVQSRKCITNYVERYETNDFIVHASNDTDRVDSDATRDDFEYIKAVDGISYYDSDEISIALKNFSFPNNKSSYRENSGIILTAENNETFNVNYNTEINDIALGGLNIGDYTFTKQDPFGTVYTLCSFKTSVHSPFSQESLVSMGKLNTNLETFDPTNQVAFSGTTQNYYSGDTFINRIGHLIAADGSLNTDASTVQFMVYTTVQSYDNISYRQSGKGEHEFNPNNTDLADEILDVFRETDDLEASIFSDNYYAYDEAHSLTAYLKAAIPDQSSDKLVKRLPTRVIRSAEQNPESNEDSFRRFLENDYLDLPSNRGDINKLATNSNILIVHTDNSLFQTRGREELATGDFRAFLGSGDIFEVQPTEIFNTKHGFAGIQDVHSAIETKSGYFFVDSFNRRPYLLSDGIEDLAEKGMKNFFNENLQWFIDEAEDHNNIPFVDMAVDYDERYSRIIFTKVDYKPTQTLLNALGSTITFNSATGKFQEGTTVIEYSNSTYFEDKSFTLSYLPGIKAWVSFHSYKPLFYMSDGFSLYSYKNAQFHKHNSDSVDYMNYYGSQKSMHMQIVDNREPTRTKHLTNVEFITDVEDRATNSDIWDKTFERIRVRNSKQDSDILPLVYFTGAGGNIRNVEGTWKVNKLRDLIDPATGNIDANLEWFKKKNFIGKYALIDLYYDTPNNDKLALVDVTANFKPSYR